MVFRYGWGNHARGTIQDSGGSGDRVKTTITGKGLQVALVALFVIRQLGIPVTSVLDASSSIFDMGTVPDQDGGRRMDPRQ